MQVWVPLCKRPTIPDSWLFSRYLHSPAIWLHVTTQFRIFFAVLHLWKCHTTLKRQRKCHLRISWSPDMHLEEFFHHLNLQYINWTSNISILEIYVILKEIHVVLFFFCFYSNLKFPEGRGELCTHLYISHSYAQRKKSVMVFCK